MGGLVCANGLVDAASTSSDSIKELSQSVRGIVFLGTPFIGSSKAQWAKTTQNFLNLFKETNPELAQNLEPKSVKLTKLGEQFPQLLLSRYHSENESFLTAVFFYVDLTRKRAGVDIEFILDQESACIPGWQHTLLEADHTSMTKFSSAQDVNCVRVIGALAQLAGELIDKKTPPVEDAGNIYHMNFNGGNRGRA